MTTSQTTNLHLTKAVKGTAEPFSIDAVNANLDAIDSAVGDLQESTSPSSIIVRVIDCPIKTIADVARVYVLVHGIPYNVSACTPSFEGDYRNIYLSGTNSTYTCTSFDGVEINSDGIAVVRINLSSNVAMTGIHASTGAPTVKLSFEY